MKEGNTYPSLSLENFIIIVKVKTRETVLNISVEI